MRQASFSFPAPDYDGICATQLTTTATGAVFLLNGALTNWASAAYTAVPVRAVFPGIQRSVGVFSTGNLSAAVFHVEGFDLRGVAITATFVGATGGSSAATDAFATFTTEFSIVTTVYSTTAATSAFTIGTGATGVTAWANVDTWVNPVNLTVTITTATAAAVTPQNTQSDVQTSTAPVIFNHPTGAVTANTQSTYTSMVRYVRAIVTTNSATGVGSTIQFQQAGW